MGGRSKPVPGTPAGRGWRNTYGWVPPSVPHSLHPTSLAAPGTFSHTHPWLTGNGGEGRGRDGGNLMKLLFAAPRRQHNVRWLHAHVLDPGWGKRSTFRLRVLHSKK